MLALATSAVVAALRRWRWLFPLVLVGLMAHSMPSSLSHGWSQPRFDESADAAGLSGFHLTSGDDRKRYIVEASSAGVCVIDFDSDNRPDLFFVNGGRLEDFQESAPSSLRHALFRNLGSRSFEEVTQAAGRGWKRTLGHGLLGH